MLWSTNFNLFCNARNLDSLMLIIPATFFIMVIFLIIIQQCSVSTTRDKNSYRIKNDLLKFIYIYIDSLSLVTITVINVTKLVNTYVFKMCMQILKIN